MAKKYCSNCGEKIGGIFGWQEVECSECEKKVVLIAWKSVVIIFCIEKCVQTANLAWNSGYRLS